MENTYDSLSDETDCPEVSPPKIVSIPIGVTLVRHLLFTRAAQNGPRQQELEFDRTCLQRIESVFKKYCPKSVLRNLFSPVVGMKIESSVIFK